MEAVGAGASVLAFISLGLKSAQTIHEIISSIKDRRKTVEKAERDVTSMQSTLGRLARCRIIADRPDEALAARIKSCATDLKSFAEKLEKLAIDDNEPRLGRQWKKVKAFLSEKELAKIGAVVVEHTVGLNLHLKALESDTLFEVKDELGAVRQELSVHQTIRESQSTIIAQQTTMTATVQDTVVRITEETRNVHDTVRAAMRGSEAQGDQIMQMLNQLLGQLPGLGPRQRVDHRVVETLDEEEQHVDDLSSSEDILPYAEMSESINALLGAVRNKQGIFGFAEAKEISAALLSLLEKVAADAFQDRTASMSTYRLWTKTCSKSDLEELRQNLRAVQGMLISTRSISVNMPTKRSHLGGSIVQSHATNRSFNLPFGVLSVMKSNISRRKEPSNSPYISALLRGEADLVEETETRVYFVPRLGSTQQGFQAVMRQYHDARGTYNTIPSLSVKNILPMGSTVFNIVRQGRVADLEEMLRSGKASLNDHDEAGASLLFYSTAMPDMCRFLLQHGADIDHVAPVVSSLGICYYEKATALETVHLPDPESRNESSKERALECQRLLLEADCNPAVSTTFKNMFSYEDGMCRSFFDGVTGAMLDHSSGLFTTKPIIYEHMAPLSAYIFGRRYTFEGLSFLQDRGADVRARDPYGRTCLHTWALWKAQTGRIEYLQQARRSITYLIQRGADVFAVDNWGQFAFQAPYDNNGVNNSAKGDLWDVILADIGVDVGQVRKMHQPRKAWYGDGYTRRTFEQLWKGREHLCPYCYDEEVPITNEESEEDIWTELEDSSDEEDGGGCALEEPQELEW